MKKLLFTSIAIIAASMLTASAQFAGVFSTNVAAGGTYLLSTSPMSINTVIVSSANAGLVQIRDVDALTGYSTNSGTLTNITPAYTSYASYYTNTIATNIVGLSGYTNYYTNAGLWTYSVANTASTNLATVQAAYAVGAGQVGVYPASVNLSHGLTITTTTNVAFTVYYTISQ
jgi:hypothetical protein